MTAERTYVVVGSETAWVDPIVMVHAVGCRCQSVARADEQWTVDSMSAEEARRIEGAVWMDCALFGPYR